MSALYRAARAEYLRAGERYAELTDLDPSHWPAPTSESVLVAGAKMRIAAKEMLRQKRASCAPGTVRWTGGPPP